VLAAVRLRAGVVAERHPRSAATSAKHRPSRGAMSGAQCHDMAYSASVRLVLLSHQGELDRNQGAVVIDFAAKPLSLPNPC